MVGDRLPIAMRALQKSTGKTAAQIEKMLEQGQLGADQIKPFIKAMGDLATANGAYEKALLKLGTVEARMKTNAGLAAARIGEAGFTKGLIQLYSELIRVFQTNDQAINELGNTFNIIFRAVSRVIKIFEPLVQGLISAFGSLARIIEYLNTKLGTAGLLGTIGVVGFGLSKLGGIAKIFGVAFTRALMAPIAKLYLLIGLIDEVRAFFDADIIGMFDEKNLTKQQREKIAEERRSGNLLAGLGIKNEQGFTPQQQDSMAVRRDILGMPEEGDDQKVLRRNMEVLEQQKNSDKLLDRFSYWISNVTGNEAAKAVAYNTNQFTITIDGSKDPQRTAEAVERFLSSKLAESIPLGAR